MYNSIFPPNWETSKPVNDKSNVTIFSWPRVPFVIKSLGEMKLYDIPDLSHAVIEDVISNKRRYTVTEIVGDCGYIKSQDAWVYLPDVHVLEGD